MAEPFISEIRMWGFNWAPRDWALCDGQSIPVTQNPALFSLLGTNFGGDGRTTFNLPDLRGRSPVNFGNNQNQAYNLGQFGGLEYVQLSIEELGQHTHTVKGTTNSGNTKQFTNAIFADGFDASTKSATEMYAQPSNLVPLNDNSVSQNGGNGSHTNVQPTLVLNFCIALTGVFPSRN